MELKIEIETLRKQSLMVATPMYGGQCAGMYTRSVADLSSVCTKYQIPLTYYFLFNESLVTRARNYCVDEFLRSNCTHLMFIDSDIGFDPSDVIAMLGMSAQNPDYHVLCGPYPKKTIAWEKVVQAVNKGLAKDDPNQLEKYVGDFVFNPKSGVERIAISEPCEVLEGGTGFMLIQRKVFEEYEKRFAQLKYRPDHVRTKSFDGSREIMAYFDAVIDDKYQNIDAEIDAFVAKFPDATAEEMKVFLKNKTTGLAQEKYSNRYLSEDYMFCYNVQKIGMKVWLCPWMKLKHVGSYIFGGSLADLAQAGATATADVSLLNKDANFHDKHKTKQAQAPQPNRGPQKGKKGR